MSDYSDLMTAVVARINTVSNVGQVHPRWRYSATWDVFLDQMKSSGGDILGWMVTLPQIDSLPSSFGANERLYSIEVFGIQKVYDGDNTEASFLALTEAVMDALDGRKDFALSNVIDYSIGPTSAKFDNRMFGSVLCHSVQLTVPVRLKKAVTYA